MLNYKDKLKQFNSTDKYRNELLFLTQLLDPKEDESIIDYGCGTGAAMEHIRSNFKSNVYGFDVTEDYYEGDKFFFRTEIFFKVQSIYFMHSFAHIDFPPLEKLKDDFLLPQGKVVIITPNIDWLNLQSKDNYKPDTTVAHHYSSSELEALFIDNGYSIRFSGQFGEQINNVHERLFLVAEIN